MADSQGFNPVQVLKAFVRNSPWMFMAIAIHVILIAIAAVSYMQKHETPREETVTAIAVSAPREEFLEELVQPPEVIDRKAVPKNEEAELVTYEEDVYIPTTEAQVEDLRLDRGDPNALDNLPTGGTTGGTAIGVGSGGHHGTGKPSPYGGRKLGSGMKKGRAGGPTQGTEKAVLDGLRWLCRHQNPDGSWGLATLRDRCLPDQVCFNPKDELDDHHDAGLTGLALLAFLGAGFSHESKQDIVDTTLGKRHKVGEVVKNGLMYLVKNQGPDGSFSKHRPHMYDEALASLALAEAYGLTQNRYWKDPAQKGIDFLQQAQRPNPSGQGLWGWRYASRMDIEQLVGSGTGVDDSGARDLYDSDTSATGWAVMALKSAQISGLNVKPESMQGAMAFCNFVTATSPQQSGLVGYQKPNQAGQTIGGKNDHFDYHIASMSALGMCIRIFAEHNIDDPFLEAAAKRIVQDLPVVSAPDGEHKDRKSVDYYYWYYASLALNQFDGPDSPRKSNKYWGPWNKAMVDAVIELQDQSDRTCNSGGWIVRDRWTYDGGPVYTTAINVLTLEVYYRYENAFGGAKRN
ncbi:MAG: hypothetical protein M3M99_01605 [Actinomycetota bacterium]|nr:hypothetical protein [Actinomycetota bacterium]